MLLKTLLAQQAPLWLEFLGPEVINAPQFELLSATINQAYRENTVYPETDFVFNALRLTAPEDVKVVILGQDPYAGRSRGIVQAHGLSFSVREGCVIPPSLRNVFKELNCPSDSGDLTPWAESGVLLLNTALTVNAGHSGSHLADWVWFTRTLISKLAASRPHIVWMLWGSHAQKHQEIIGDEHHILKSAHPSPRVRYARIPFIGNGHFTECNKLVEGISWQI